MLDECKTGLLPLSATARSLYYGDSKGDKTSEIPLTKREAGMMKGKPMQWALGVYVTASTRLSSLRRDERGQGLVEYGLIIGLVAIALVTALGLLTGGLQSIFKSITGTLSGA